MTLLSDSLRTFAGAIDRRYGVGRSYVPVTDRVELTPDEGGRRSLSLDEVYRANVSVHAMVNLIGNQVMRLPLRVYEGDPDGEYEPVDGRSSLPTLLRCPAPGKGAAHLKRGIAASLASHGNSTFGKYRQGGEGSPPTELLKLDWPHMSAYANYGGPIELWTSSQGDGKEHAISTADVVHTFFEPPVGVVGIAPAEVLESAIAVNDGAERYQEAFFRNGVRPSGAFVVPEGRKLDAQERIDLKAMIQRQSGGVDNAFRAALLTGGTKWEPMGFNADESALIPTRELSRDEVFIAYGFPATLVGDFRRATFSNVTETNRALFTIFLAPWLVLIQDCLQAQLIDPEPEWAGQFVRFDLSDVLKGDPLQEAQAQALLVEAGITVRDEGRQRLGLRKLGGGSAVQTFAANNHAAVSSLLTAGGLPAPPPPPAL